MSISGVRDPVYTADEWDWVEQQKRWSLGWVVAREDANLPDFYLGACGFSPTAAGLISL